MWQAIECRRNSFFSTKKVNYFLQGCKLGEAHQEVKEICQDRAKLDVGKFNTSVPFGNKRPNVLEPVQVLITFCYHQALKG